MKKVNFGFLAVLAVGVITFVYLQVSSGNTQKISDANLNSKLHAGIGGTWSAGYGTAGAK